MVACEMYNRSVESGALDHPQTRVPDSEKNQSVPAVKSAEFESELGPGGRPVDLQTFNPGVVGSNPTGPSRALLLRSFFGPKSARCCALS